jgi:hypothetical protein
MIYESFQRQAAQLEAVISAGDGPTYRVVCTLPHCLVHVSQWRYQNMEVNCAPLRVLVRNFGCSQRSVKYEQERKGISH